MAPLQKSLPLVPELPQATENTISSISYKPDQSTAMLDVVKDVIFEESETSFEVSHNSKDINLQHSNPNRSSYNNIMSRKDSQSTSKKSPIA